MVLERGTGTGTGAGTGTKTKTKTEGNYILVILSGENSTS